MSRKILIVTVLLAVICAFAADRRPAVGRDYVTVEVKEGDTFYGIALKYLKNPGRWKELAKYNGIDDPNKIRVGMKIKIPNNMLKEAPSEPSPKPAGPIQTPAPDTPVKPEGLVEPTASGSVFHVARDVVLLKTDGSDQTLRVGKIVAANDRVVTDSLSFCSISLGTGRLIVGPDTRLMLVALDRAGDEKTTRIYIKLLKGYVRFDTTAKFDVRVKTDAALIKARAARFAVRVEEETGNFIDVYSGSVEVNSGPVVKKAAIGQGLVVESEGVVIGAADLPPAPLMEPREVTVAGKLHKGGKWAQVPGAVSYRVEVALDENFDRPVYLGGYAGNTIDFNFLATYPKGWYYIRLISVNKQGLWSAPSNHLPYNNFER